MSRELALVLWLAVVAAEAALRALGAVERLVRLRPAVTS